MLNCKDVTQLASESSDRPLNLHERLGLKLHTSMCNTCRQFQKLQNRIHDAIVSGGGDFKESEASRMSEDCRDRVNSAVQSAIRDQSLDG